MKNVKGMTLVEVIVAVTIFAVAAVILFSGFLYIMNLNLKSDDLRRATSALNEKLDKWAGDIVNTPQSINVTVNGRTYTITGTRYEASFADRLGTVRQRVIWR